MPQEVLCRCRDVSDDLPEEKWRNIAAAVHRNRSSASVGMPELFVRIALTNLYKTHLLQYADHLARLQNRKTGHA